MEAMHKPLDLHIISQMALHMHVCIQLLRSILTDSSRFRFIKYGLSIVPVRPPCAYGGRACMGSLQHFA